MAKLDYIRRVLSVAETGQPEWNSGVVYVYLDDNRFEPARRQITLSIGFTEGGGNLKKLLERYVEAEGPLARDLQAFLPGLGDKSRGSLAGNHAFIELLKKAGTDPIMKRVQCEQFDAMYLNPAMSWAEQHGFTLDLSFLVIADSFLHSGSMLGFLMAKFPEKKPNAGGDEKKWISEYLDARAGWLRNHSNPILRKTVYRVECFMHEAHKDNWNLDQEPLVMNGTIVPLV
jgi:chitosanase